MQQPDVDLTPGEDWRESLNATCNRLTTQYLNLIRAASSATALEAYNKNKDGGSNNNNNNVKHIDPRSGGGSGQKMNSLQDPPPPPLAADVTNSSLQCQLAAENLCVATSQLLSLIRTLRLSILLMDEETIAAEEEWQVQQLQAVTEQAKEQANMLEQEWIALRNQQHE